MISEFVEQAGYVIVEEARGYEWRTWREFDGPALVAEAEAGAAAAERDRRDQAEAAQREQRHATDYAQQTARNMLAAHLDQADAHDRLARLMAQPPAPATNAPDTRPVADEDLPRPARRRSRT